ncbi:MAG: gamma-glutamyl-gamma-aminobutyrate hydrolase family protein [Bacillota bacterium]|nr:gamma-glutamyl-gamma-aminobutyrate hydrolase family protein [Bacillota bacterium]MDW7683659.1 gamma-glutamyl-gamma-aminobutyrate hydrolase family protein [Bacillota bacterium]
MPKIGITCNRKGSEHSLSAAYVRAVARSGALPLLLPACPGRQLWENMLQSVDALLLSGGGDPDARLFGEEPSPRQGEVQPARDSMELYLARQALARGIPLLGICRGAQIMAVAAGGTLHQDLVGIAAVQHDQKAPRTYPIHQVTIRVDSRLHNIVGAAKIRVNSMHHQAVKHPGNLQVCGFAADGVIEAVELTGHPFALGVQWHPEWLEKRTGHAAALFTALCAAAAAAS